MATSKNMTQFTKRFIDFLIVEWDPNLTDPTPMEQIENIRKNLLEEFNINHFSDQDEKLMKSLIEKEYAKFLENNNLDNANDLVDVLILRKAEINEKEQIKYLDLVKEFQKTQRIENLYYFGDILDEDTSFKAENALKDIIQEMNNKNKAELLASISVYLEHIKDTKDGKAFINQLNSQEPHEWYNELFQRMHESSPLAPSFDYILEERKIKHHTQTSGLFDGLYYSLREDKKTGQLQISATSSVDSDWEGNSVLRHALANSIINNALEDFFIQEAKKELGVGAEYHMAFYEEKIKEKAFDLIQDRLLVKDFMAYDKNEKNSNRNIQMAKTIQNAVNQYLGKNFDSFDTMIKDLTAKPTRYIKEKISKEKISKEKLKDFIEGNELFTNDSYFISYSPSSVSLDAGIKKTTLWNNVIGEEESLLSPEEFKAKSQYMALMGHNIGKRDLDLEAVEYFFGEHINLRALNQRNRINNSRFENDKEFERMIVEHFILESPGNIEKNLELLDRKTSKNIESYVNYYLKGMTEENYRSKLSSSHINYSGDYYDLISNVSGGVYQSDDLNEILKERQNTLNEKKERIESEEEKFINKGLRKLDSSEDVFEEFIKTSSMNEIDVLSVRKLKELGFDGEDKEVDFERIKAIKAECKKYNDNLDCGGSGAVINGANKKVSSFTIKNK
jgi:hypothetical protein